MSVFVVYSLLNGWPRDSECLSPLSHGMFAKLMLFGTLTSRTLNIEKDTASFTFWMFPFLARVQ